MKCQEQHGCSDTPLVKLVVRLPNLKRFLFWVCTSHWLENVYCHSMLATPIRGNNQSSRSGAHLRNYLFSLRTWQYQKSLKYETWQISTIPVKLHVRTIKRIKLSQTNTGRMLLNIITLCGLNYYILCLHKYSILWDKFCPFCKNHMTKICLQLHVFMEKSHLNV